LRVEYLRKRHKNFQLSNRIASVQSKRNPARNACAGIEPSRKQKWVKSRLPKTLGGILDLHIVGMTKDPRHSFVKFVVAVIVAEEDMQYLSSALVTERSLADYANAVCRFGAMMSADESLFEHCTTILTIVVAFFDSV
jgi:hypothetical protein